MRSSPQSNLGENSARNFCRMFACDIRFSLEKPSQSANPQRAGEELSLSSNQSSKASQYVQSMWVFSSIYLFIIIFSVSF